MASEIRVNQINNRSGLSTITFSDTGVVISGITTISDLRASGNTIVAAGTTAAPSISPSGDSNTGIFFPSPDTVCIGEGGVEVLRVDSNGRLGIGTNNPTTTLDVLSSGTALKLSTATNNTHIQFRDTTNSNEGYLNFINNSLVYYRSGPVEAFKSDSSGNLTISNGNLVIGTSGKGIDFSATANSSFGTTTSELLSDYEEGTWTPVDASGAGLTLTVNGTPRYTKIGRLVIFICNFITYPSTANGAVAIIGGLPFTCDSNVGGSLCFISNSANANRGLILNNSNSIYLYSTTTLNASTNSAVSGSSIYGITGSYFVA